jgi:1,4-dihydroxy-2-naphthoyl-CoA hydrolase
MDIATIWFDKTLTIEKVRQGFLNMKTMGTHLDMQFEALGADSLTMSMPVDERTKQPYGLLHGGASCALAETVGSIASALVIDTEKQICVGLEINANHLRAARNGRVFATAQRIHIGNTTHVWDIKITNEQQKLVCISRLTVAILKNTNLVG